MSPLRIPRLLQRTIVAALALCFLLALNFAIDDAVARAQDGESGAPLRGTPLTGAIDVAVGTDFACALITDGTIFCWGRGFDGQLGDGKQFDSLVPVQVLGIDDAVKISAGNQHACALRANGRTSCWGSGVSGALGHAHGGIVATPMDVPWASPAVDISTNQWHTCALLEDGRVRCWEQWWTTDMILLQTAGKYPGAVALSGDQWSGCVLMDNRDVNCWTGRDIQLGPNGDSPRRREYERNDKVLEDAEEIVVTWGRSCGVVAGEIWCWGVGWSPNYASEDPEDSTLFEVPTLQRGIEDVAEITLGSDLCARRHDGRIFCKVYANSTGWSEQPAQEEVDRFTQIPVIDDALAIARGLSSACAIVDAQGEKRVRCWGFNGMGQMGNGTSTSVDTPALVAGTEGARDIALAGSTTCALLDDGNVTCWGMPTDSAWQEGSSSASYLATVQALPAPAIEIGGFGELVSGYPSGSLFAPMSYAYRYPRFDRICAAHVDGTFSCAGEDLVRSFDDFGIPPPPPRTITETTPMVKEVVQLAVGQEHLCALTEREEVYCFGRNQWGQTGIDLRLDPEGNTSSDTLLDIPLPQLVPGMTDVVDLSASETATCAVKRNGSLWCWGAYFGAHADFTPYTGNVPDPKPSQILASGVRRVSTRGNTCVAMGDQGAQCWGTNLNGVLGVVEEGWIPPTHIPGLDIVDDVAVGFDQTCFLSQGEVWCTGVTTRREVMADGKMRTAYSTEPFKMELPGRALAIEAGNNHMCAIVVIDGHTQVACWGWNDAGQVGTNPGWDPVEVQWAPSPS